MSKPRIPFGVWPYTWGMKDQTRELAKAEYELEGEDLDRKKLNIIHRDDEDLLAAKLLEMDLKYKQISQLEYDKQSATMKGEPWVSVLSLETDPKSPSSGNIELDWNDEFVSYLQENGYIGASEEMVVDAWLGELCKNIALEHYSGTGSFDEDVGADDDKRQPTGEAGKWVIK